MYNPKDFYMMNNPQDFKFQWLPEKKIIVQITHMTFVSTMNNPQDIYAKNNESYTTNKTRDVCTMNNTIKKLGNEWLTKQLYSK